MPSYRPLWLNRELTEKVEKFIKEKYNINPSFGNLFAEVARGAIYFALSKPVDFKAFLDKRAAE